MHLQSVSIIGANGAMGAFFSNRLREAGLQVQGLDKPLDSQELHSSLPGCDLILLAIPAQAFETVLPRIQEYLDQNSVLADICSVKIKPLELMLSYHQGPVVGTHPLFGPAPEPGTSLRTALVQGRDKDALHQIHDLMQDIGLESFICGAKEHDRALAYIQGLNFVSTVSYLAALTDEPGLERFLTPSFRRRLDAARKMLTQDADLFQNLFEANPFSYEAVRQYRQFLNLAAAGELDLLQHKASWWWQEQNKGGGT
ncbi:MAG: prephenate dehydrogenase/arogenate dehydrogenase family protein [Desulfohalobiaceae bacterium]